MPISETIKNLIEQLGLYSLVCYFMKVFWQFPIGHNQKINKLEINRRRLNSRKNDVITKMKTEMGPCKIVKDEVLNWVSEVERVSAAIDHLVATSTSQVGFRGFVSRGCLQNDVAEKTAEVEELLRQEVKDFNGLVMDDPIWIGQHSVITTSFGELPKKLIRQIWVCLKDDRVSKISVWGVEGVGKTNIMRFINRLRLDGTIMFKKVIWVTVSQNFNITTFQNDIVRELEVSPFKDDDDKKTRASKLRQLLTNLAIEGRYVLILDDLWHNLSLEDVGIPQPSNGCKLVIITRPLNVCYYLDASPNSQLEEGGPSSRGELEGMDHTYSSDASQIPGLDY